ncbi:(4Fe-4S)-binding protein [Aureitalea marina]|uniref:Iron-binding zinc finger CDGSH type domain-containing protein n=1 Tax=Aureitalea marina TaxID=930804 RepID=A0A2S7KM99_9FLAO|nr:(4Fe-4S)-binding protein [Aureitalea marina]PQB03754.1 hypothetical protein BST85_01680 [Aureitalea marina]
MDIRKEYDNGQLTVVWKPGLCFHAKECVKGLPGVFNPDRKPWIQVDQATTEALMATIDKCPSGALSYYKTADGPPQSETQPESALTVEIMDPGPALIKGKIQLTQADGSVEEKDGITAICRCGKTGNSPFCDGSHNS